MTLKLPKILKTFCKYWIYYLLRKIGKGLGLIPIKEKEEGFEEIVEFSKYLLEARQRYFNDFCQKMESKRRLVKTGIPVP
jgi:hypothetical protein